MISGSDLQGNLKSMGISDLLQWIGQASKTGTLHIDKGCVRKKVFFEDGVILSSTSNDPREFLGQYLLRHGVISEEQLRNGLEEQKGSGQLLGQILLEKGLIDGEMLGRLLRLKVEETLFSLFLWEEGTFKFVEEEAFQKNLVRLEAKLEEILQEGRRRFETLQKIRKDFPTDRTILGKINSPPPPEELSHPMAARVYHLVDGNRSIADICLEAHASEFPVSFLLHKLYEEGHLAIAGGVQKTIPSHGEAIIVLRDQAKGMLQKGDFESALILLEQLQGNMGENSEIPKLLDEAEKGFVEQALRHFLPLKKIPILIKPLEDLTSEELTPEEGFLVTRINGSWNIESIINISPMREINVLRTLKRLREQQIIQLDDPPGDVDTR